jgi:RNA recognition motif-containing protein
MNCTVFIGNLAFDIDVMALAEALEDEIGFGQIASLKIATDADSGQSKGFAHADFFTAEIAVDAVRKLDGLDVFGREIRVERKKRAGEIADEPKRFGMKDRLQQETSRDDRREREYQGSTGPRENTSRSFSPSSRPELRPVVETWKSRASNGGSADSGSWATVYVGDLPYKITDENLKFVVESTLSQGKGTVAAVRQSINKDTGLKRGFGYVDFKTLADAERAVKELNGMAIMGRPCKMDLEGTSCSIIFSINCFVIALQSIYIRFANASQSICTCFVIALRSLCNRFAIALQSLCNRNVIALQSLCNRFAIASIALQLLCNRFAIALQSLCNRFAIALQSLCDRFAIALRSLCNRFAIAVQSLCNHFAFALQSLCNRFALALQSLCDRFAIALQSLCNRFAFALHLLCNQSLCIRFAIAVHSLCNRFAIALQSLSKSLSNRFAIALLSLCKCFANALQSLALRSLCNRFAIALKSLCNRFAIVLQSLCNRFAIALLSLCKCFANALHILYYIIYYSTLYHITSHHIATSNHTTSNHRDEEACEQWR